MTEGRWNDRSIERMHRACSWSSTSKRQTFGRTWIPNPDVKKSSGNNGFGTFYSGVGGEDGGVKGRDEGNCVRVTPDQ